MRRRFKRGSHENKLEFELNIVPIIDCFTILITFLLSSGAFLAIGHLSVSVSGGDAAASEVSPAPIQISVSLEESMGMRLRVTGAVSKNIELAPVGGKRDLAGLKAELSAEKAGWPDQNSVTVESPGDLAYEDLIVVMEAVKQSHDDVLLGGF